ncbi:MAG: hypothetical protein QNK30_00720 [Bacteroidales bacterium]|nr:hypothetical protein [Bacteroidales bacterium]
MKYIFIIASTILLTCPLFGQNQHIELDLNELSFNLFSVKERQVVKGGQKYYPYYFQGISYKRRFNTKNFVRSSFNYFQKLDEVSDQDTESVGNFSEIEFAVGYQREFLTQWLRPYVAADLKILWGKSDQENDDRAQPSFENFKMNYFGVGVSPVAGILFKTPTPLSIAFELSFDFLMVWESGTRYYWEPDVVPINEPIEDSGYVTRFNPVAGIFIILDF